MTASPLSDDEIRLPDGARLALRRADAPGRPFLLAPAGRAEAVRR